MANSDITFDTGDVSSIVSVLRSNAESLTSISNSAKSGFTPLTELGLFSDQITKFASKLSSIQSSIESIVSAISGQSTTYEAVEKVVSSAADDYMSYYDGGSGSGSRSSSSGGSKNHYKGEGEIDLSLLNKGKEISTERAEETLDLKLDNLDDKTLIQLINFMNNNMTDNLTLSSLLTMENSSILATYLKKFFKASDNQELSANDINNVREVLLQNILNTDLDMPKDLKDNSLIQYKPYLSKMAESMNIDCYTLLNDEAYKDARDYIITNLCSGTAIGDTSSLSENYANEFLNLVVEKAQENNISAEDVLNNPILLV